MMILPKNEFIAPYFLYHMHVFIDDTDAGGIVYHPKYLTFAEKARVKFLHHAGVTLKELDETHDCLFVVHSLNIRFVRSARLEDHLVIKSQITELGAAKMSFVQQIYQNETMITDIYVKVGCIQTSGRVIRIPQTVKERLQPYLYLAKEQ